MLLFVALIYKGKRLLVHETNRNDIQSALLPEGMKKACVFMLVENGLALWLVGLFQLFFCRSLC